jgi:hypothetical protein
MLAAFVISETVSSFASDLPAATACLGRAIITRYMHPIAGLPGIRRHTEPENMAALTSYND